MINITEIIDEIPRILQYFVSGFIFLKLFCFLNAKDNNNTSFFTIWSVVISFFIISVVKTLDALILPNCNFVPWSEVAVCIFVGMIFSFLVYRINNSKLFSYLLNLTTRKSINTDIWRDIIDYKKGTTFKVFLKNQKIEYIGKLCAHEEKGADSWFVFKDYICSYIDKEEEFNSTIQEFPTVVAINLNEIERIELFYNKDTEVFN